jgi:hypothetical protein
MQGAESRCCSLVSTDTNNTNNTNSSSVHQGRCSSHLRGHALTELLSANFSCTSAPHQQSPVLRNADR